MENDEGSDDKFNLICNMKASFVQLEIYIHTHLYVHSMTSKIPFSLLVQRIIWETFVVFVNIWDIEIENKGNEN